MGRYLSDITPYIQQQALKDIQEAFNKADKALYKAKETRRNKVELYK